MSRPIDADALKKWINDQLLLDDDDQEPLYADGIKITESKPCHDNQLIWSSDVMDAIDRAPTVEPEEVKPKLVYADTYTRMKYYRCPVCEADIYQGQRYCEDCGRKMKWDD